ncbi:MAG TPA: tRNA pseudouridine(55) synthase TruB [Planctomycetaceae bacterium]|nr:tRNA pseudouridine(55) synthase TruB [Planctomycetaceae bacterium]
MDTETDRVFGLLCINKPLGLTSRDVVNRVVWRLRESSPKPAKIPKVGHAGTLDPLATGVLLVGVGAGVRLVPYLHQQPKEYLATFRLGQSSQSGDLESPIVAEENPHQPTRDEIDAAAKALIGDITQIPPAHSAIKIGGKKAYKFAHQGKSVEVPSRVVRIDEINILDYSYPDVTATIRCGTGTYIRTLGIDLAAKCNTTAVMTSLVRTAIGKFSLETAISIDRIADTAIDDLVLPLARGVAHLPKVDLPQSQIDLLTHGIKIVIDPESETPGDEVAVIDRQGNLRAIVQRRDGKWNPYRVFHCLR